MLNIKKQRHYFADKCPYSWSCGFPSSHVWMWGLGQAPKTVLEKTLESPLDCKKIKPVSPKGNQSWIFIGKTDAEAEAPILWPLDAQSWLTGKRPWYWERLKAKGEEDNRWDGWMASLTQWTWIWANSQRQWRTEEPGVLQFMGSQRVGHDLRTKEQTR